MTTLAIILAFLMTMFFLIGVVADVKGSKTLDPTYRSLLLCFMYILGIFVCVHISRIEQDTNQKTQITQLEEQK